MAFAIHHPSSIIHPFIHPSIHPTSLSGLGSMCASLAIQSYSVTFFTYLGRRGRPVLQSPGRGDQSPGRRKRGFDTGPCCVGIHRAGCVCGRINLFINGKGLFSEAGHRTSNLVSNHGNRPNCPRRIRNSNVIILASSSCSVRRLSGQAVIHT